MKCGWRFAMTFTGQPKERQAVTLLELLVVVTILLILLAVMVPRLRPMMEQRRIREASRTVSGFFYAARSRAMETGRPVGVAIERLKSQPEAAVTLRMVEVPPPYCGDTTTAKARVQKLNDGSFKVEFTGDVSMLGQLVKIGDIITFESQGVRYRIESQDSNSLIVTLLDLTDTPWPVEQKSRPVSFQIHRRPESTAAPPVRLPTGTVIDLYSSGTDSMALPGSPAGFVPVDHNSSTPEIEDASPVIVLFAPDGRVQRVFYQSEEKAVTEPIYFLIGRWERMPAVASTPRGQPLADDGLYNWQDLTNFWLVVNPNTGLAVVAPLSGDGVLPGTNVKVPSDLYISRNDARLMKGVGGR